MTNQINHGAKILVIDDDKPIADMLGEYCRRLGHQVDVAYNGHDAFNFFQQKYYNLLIVDLVMPDIDGIKLLEKVKAFDRNIVVVLISGYGTIELAVEAIKKGAYDFIPKPLQLKPLEIIINRALERHSLLKKISLFRGLTLALLISVPFWLILGIVLAYLIFGV